MRLDQLFRPFAFVEADIIEDHDVTGRQCRHKRCLTIHFSKMRLFIERRQSMARSGHGSTVRQ